MNHQHVYELSKKHGPPRIDLRMAQIIDGGGDESLATDRTNHRTPNNVSRADLVLYGWVYSFLKLEDLLFYLYPIALEFERNNSLFIDSFLYSLNRLVSIESSKLSKDDQQALLDGLRWIWNSAPLGYADWIQCPNLQKAIGVSVTWDDLGWDH